MGFTKIYLKTKHKETGKLGKILAIVSDNKILCNFFNHQQGELAYKKLLSEGKKAIFSRGIVIQLFKDIPQEKLVEIAREDIKQTPASVGVDIIDYKEEKIK